MGLRVQLKARILGQVYDYASRKEDRYLVVSLLANKVEYRLCESFRILRLFLDDI